MHDDPSNADLAPLEKAYFESGFEVRAVLSAIFNAPSFYSQKARYALIKSPVDFVVITMRTLEAPMLTVNKLDQTIAEMGQDLFNPPSVKGWDGGRAWINSRTLLSRVNFATDLANRANGRGALEDLVKKYLAATIPDYAERLENASGLDRCFVGRLFARPAASARNARGARRLCRRRHERRKCRFENQTARTGEIDFIRAGISVGLK